MHYSSFPGRINVEKTSKQCFQPLLLPENQKAVGNETDSSTRLDNGQMDGGIE